MAQPLITVVFGKHSTPDMEEAIQTLYNRAPSDVMEFIRDASLNTAIVVHVGDDGYTGKRAMTFLTHFFDIGRIKMSSERPQYRQADQQGPNRSRRITAPAADASPVGPAMHGSYHYSPPTYLPEERRAQRSRRSTESVNRHTVGGGRRVYIDARTRTSYR